MMKLPPPFSMIFSFSVVLLALSMVGTGTSVAAAAGGDAAYEQCNGIAPQESLVQYLGMTLDYELADRICCNNQHSAEPRGYLEWEPDVAFFRHLEEQQPNFDANTTETIFYDSVCGLPVSSLQSLGNLLLVYSVILFFLSSFLRTLKLIEWHTVIVRPPSSFSIF